MITRIDAVCSLIRPGASLADIGCDHGLVAKYALDHGVQRVVAADISEKSLSKACALLSDYENARFIVSDGFDEVDERVEQAVIAGLGGSKIVDLISRLDYRPSLVLGAQCDQRKLREHLITHGYKITHDFCFYDRGKYYDFIRAEEGISPPLTGIQLEFGAFYKEKNPHLKAKAEELKGKILGYKLTPRNENRLKMTEEVLSWQS